MTNLSTAEIETLFPLEGTPALGDVPYPPEKIDKIVNSFFTEKEPPQNREDAKVKILLGAPGAGKSYNAAIDYDALDQDKKNQTIYVSYDENGAIYRIPGFKEELVAILGRDFEQHEELDSEKLTMEQYAQIEAVWEKYRPLSQHIRSKILKKAAAEGYSMVIDTTSSSPGALKMIESLKKAGYTKSQIEIEGTYAPFQRSKDRIERRPRKASYEELITKRVGDPTSHKGALNMIAPLVQAAGKFTYRFNPDNSSRPREAFVFKNGQLFSHDEGVCVQIDAAIIRDTVTLTYFIPEVAASIGSDSLANYQDHARSTMHSLRSFLSERVFNRGRQADPSPQT